MFLKKHRRLCFYDCIIPHISVFVKYFLKIC
nr:MAG TPA: hypothetical protein [Caudoviricetes sp.]